jgi:hypothetical protein
MLPLGPGASTGIRLEQETGLVDIYWEYTETSVRIFNNVPDKLAPGKRIGA